MELKNIFKMTKTDRYTQDGRDELAKLQETEDVTYKTGDISQKTGLQKQPDGSWAPPKGGAKKPAGKKPDAAWTETRMASGKLYDLKSQGKRIIEQYDPETETKTFKLRDLNNSRAPDKEFKTLEEAKAAAGKSKPAGTEISPQDIARGLDELTTAKGGSKNIGGVKVTYVPGNGYRVTHKAPSGTELTTGYDSIEEAQQAVMFRLNRIKKGEIPAISESAESKPADMLSSKDPAILNKYKPETEEEKNEIKKMQQFMEEETGATLRNAILARESYYNNSPSEYKNEAGKAALSNIKKIFGYGTQKDAAPRQLTGDTKIRIKK